jgi:ribosome-associated protein
MKLETKEFVEKICQVIQDKKGFNVMAIYVGDFSTVADYVIVAEGNVDRHIAAISHAVVAEFRDQGIRPHHVEGLQSGEWVLLDYSNVVVHLFLPHIREKYQLERLFASGKPISIPVLEASVLSC